VQWGKNELIIGWARRMVPYKRPLALFSDLQRFVQIAKTAGKPVHVIMAGLAHQSDDSGREILSQLQHMIANELKGSVIYLPHYNTTIAKMLISGCDVWLNTPVVGSEACGTSGMKASLNGTLPCSTKDGWMDEVNLSEIGWSLESDTITDSLLNTLEHEIVPAYYGDDKSKWETLQKNGHELIVNQFSATRMLKDYFEKTYLPIITTSYEHYEF
jgi:starch phosphorylase